MERTLKITTIALLASCMAVAGCAADPAKQGTAPVAACQAPAGSVCLTQQELSVLGPIVGSHFQQLQQEYQNLSAVIQDIQRQTAPPPAPAAPAPAPKK